MTIHIRKNQFISLFLLFIVIVLSITILITNNQQKTYRSKAQETISPAPEASPSAQIALLETVIESKNIETDNLLNKYEQTTDEGEKQKLVSSLETNLTDRKKNLLSLLQLSPLSVYNKSFDQNKIDKLQKVEKIKDKHLVEERISVKGKINITHIDNFIKQTTREEFTLIEEEDKLNTEISFYPLNLKTSFISQSIVEISDGVKIIEDELLEKMPQSYLGSSAYAQETMFKKIKSHILAPVEKIFTISKPTLTPLKPLGIQDVVVIFKKSSSTNDEELPNPAQMLKVIRDKVPQFIQKSSYGKFNLKIYGYPQWHSSPVEKNNESMINSIPFDVKEKTPDLIDILQKNDTIVIIVKGDLPTNLLSMEGHGSTRINNSLHFLEDSTVVNQNIKAIIYTEVEKNFDELSFYRLIRHELGHAFGFAQHAGNLACSTNIFNSIPEIKLTNSDSVEDSTSGTCKYKEYGNRFDIMGITSSFSYQELDSIDYNGFLKKEWGWIGNESTGKILTLDPQNPYGRYTINAQKESGDVVVWLPFASKNNSWDVDTDFFLEFNSNNIPGFIVPALMINFLGHPSNMDFYDGYLKPTLLFTVVATNKDGYLQSNEGLFLPHNNFIDKLHNMLVSVENIDEKTKTLTFSIYPYNKFFIAPIQGGNNRFFSSINVFENALLESKKSIMKPVEFMIDNLRSEKEAKIFVNIEKVFQGKLHLEDRGSGFFPSDEKQQRIRWYTFLKLNNPRLQDSEITLSVDHVTNLQSNFVNNNKNNIIIQYYLVLSTEEYKNDLEPFMIDIKDKDTNNKEFNHLETEKGQTLIFTSNIANNSRNPDGNKSSDFFVQWTIQNEKGNNVIPPFRQKHEGIPPKSIDNANPATLTWTIPQDLPAGNYKVILEVDSNNRLQEFNENNNIIYRYFSVVE